MRLDEFKRRRPSFFGYFITALLGAIIGGMLILTLAPDAIFGRFKNLDEKVPQGLQTNVVKESTESNITSAANRVIPSVVGITTTKMQRGIFDERKVQGVGSGVIVDMDGYIITNNHVAGINSKNIVVSLYDGREVSGKVVWAEPVLDLSIVKIENIDKLRAASLGDSNNIKIAEQVIAIGNPLGLKFKRSVTAGIISAVDRTIEIEEGSFMEDLIQTDASINPGNSGGPLVNSSGEVIGINTVKVSSAEGIGFAAPINIVKPVIRSIKDKGSFTTPKLGIKGMDKEIAIYYDYKVDKGIYVYSVERGSPAYNAGIKEGDIITSINTKDIDTMMELKEMLYDIGVGNMAKLRVKSPVGFEREIDVKL